MKRGLPHKILAVLTLALAALATGFLFAAPPESHPPPLQSPDEAAALRRLMALKLPDTQGRETALSQWQGKILVVNFWATWCPPCKEEMPAFSRLQQSRGSRGVQFIGIAVDSADNVRAFSRQHPVSYPLLIGGNDVISLSRELGNQRMGLPFTLIVDRHGRIHTRKLGGIKEAELAGLLDSLTK